MGAVTGILRSFKGLAGAFLDAVGGGAGRIAYVSTGDLNNDGSKDIALSFGPVTEDAVYPNIIVVRDAATRGVIGHSFEAFPPGFGADVNYNGGEVRTAVGDFIHSGINILAAAQGVGGNGVVRLIEYTANPAPNGWRVVGQFSGLAGPAKTNNAAGGLTLAAGDVGWRWKRGTSCRPDKQPHFADPVPADRHRCQWTSRIENVFRRFSIPVPR